MSNYSAYIFEVSNRFVIPIDKIVVILSFLFEVINSNCQANTRNCQNSKEQCQTDNQHSSVILDNFND